MLSVVLERRLSSLVLGFVCSLWRVMFVPGLLVFFFFKQKTAYEVRISDWSSDVCSSDLEDGDVCSTDQIRPRRRIARRAPLLPPCLFRRQIGRASCRERVCQYV